MCHGLAIAQPKRILEARLCGRNAGGLVARGVKLVSKRRAKRQMARGMPLPEFLTANDDGLIVVAGHRIGLEDIVYYFNELYSPEMLKGQFPTLPLAVIYKTIGFYLENRDAVDAYVGQIENSIRGERAGASRSPDVAELRRRMEKLHPSKTS